MNTQLALKQAFETVQENLELKKELDSREKRELALKVSRRRLAGILNRVDDAVLAVNPAQRIGFSNQAFEALTGYCPEDILGSSVFDLFKEAPDFSPDGSMKSREQREQKDLALTCADNTSLRLDISLSLLDLEEDEFLFMILKKAGREPASSMAGSLGVIADHNRNRERLERLEVSLNRLVLDSEGHKVGRDDIKAIVGLLDQLGEKSRDMPGTRRLLAVEVMNNANL